MLVLQLLTDESVVIDTGVGLVRVTLTEIRTRGRVRIGIDAPKKMAVMRQEILDKQISSPVGSASPKTVTGDTTACSGAAG